MAATPAILSGSTSGRGIAVGTSATLIYTAPAGASDLGQPTIQVSNPTATRILLTTQVNDVAVAAKYIEAYSGWVPVLEDCVLNGATTVKMLGASTGMFAMGKQITEA